MRYIEETVRAKNNDLREMVITYKKPSVKRNMTKEQYNKWYYKMNKDKINERRKQVYANKINNLNDLNKLT